MYLPPCAANLIGPEAASTLQQTHRRHSKQVISVPVEIDAMQKRGQFQEWTRKQRDASREQQHTIVYPDSYIKQVEHHEKQASASHGESNPTQ
tara:strand:- start:217 stop:495 length:279 start_codon:yes stop_codon:yes gene_type:complete